MEIIFNGEHSGDEAAEHLIHVIRLFRERYQISHFREMHLAVTLVDAEGETVELVDSKTNATYRTFEVYRCGEELKSSRKFNRLKLVIDNEKNPS